MTRAIRHLFAMTLSLFLCSLLALFLIPVKGLWEFYTSVIVVQFLLISLAISLLFDFLNDIMETIGISKALRNFLLPIIIASVGGYISYYLWVDNKLDLDEDIYLIILVLGILNGLIISAIHFMFSIVSKAKYFKINFN